MMYHNVLPIGANKLKVVATKYGVTQKLFRPFPFVEIFNRAQPYLFSAAGRPENRQNPGAAGFGENFLLGSEIFRANRPCRGRVQSR